MQVAAAKPGNEDLFASLVSPFSSLANEQRRFRGQPGENPATDIRQPGNKVNLGDIGDNDIAIMTKMYAVHCTGKDVRDVS